MTRSNFSFTTIETIHMSARPVFEFNGVRVLFFFFQAEDGIRDIGVTGVQTCALPIWLAQLLPGVVPLPATSTAEAARQVAAGEHDAAVCAPIAAERYGLTALADDVADRSGAVTRFVLVAPPGPLPAPTGNDKTSLVAVVGDRTGALLDLLREFAVREISLTRIESRPTRERLGVYSFSLDCEGHAADARVGEALAALHRGCDEQIGRASGRER